MLLLHCPGGTKRSGLVITIITDDPAQPTFEAFARRTAVEGGAANY
jgi:hypothetical protein